MAETCACTYNPDNTRGNMYFKGEWEFCPEYDPGDVVLWDASLYMSLEHHAGKDPSKKDNREYWQPLGTCGCDDEHYGIEDIDGGYASTTDPDVFEDDDDLANTLDGGSSSERQYVPLT